MRMYELDDGSFFFDENARMAYCPICDDDVYLPQYTLVRSGDVRIVDGEAGFIDHCERCGHHLNPRIPCSDESPGIDGVIHVGTLEKI